MIAPQTAAGRGLRCGWQLARRVSQVELRALGDPDPLLGQLLWNRGLLDPAEASQFLGAETFPLAEPSLMAGLLAAVERIGAAIRSDELIAVYGDYDVDGLTGTAVLCSALRRVGARIVSFIPHRQRDGYGLQDAPLAALRENGAGLVITVDCGVTAGTEIQRARAFGLDVIVTDHHVPPDKLPDCPVLNPSRADCAYPFKELAGVGVAYRLAEAVVRCFLPEEEASQLVDELLELAAIGTLADMVPLRGENRTIVRRGLARLASTLRPGLQALLEAGQARGSLIDADRICFSVVPKLNAAGRVEHAQLALDLLLTDSWDEALALDERLQALNHVRRRLTAEGLELARQMLAGQDPAAVIVLAGPFAVGIVGLIANRLVEEFGRPAIVLRRDDQLCTGSARSVPGVSILDVIGNGAEHLERFGGHATAAGLSVQTERLAEFEAALQRASTLAQAESPADRYLLLDAELRPSTVLRWSTLELLPQLEPFGAANPAPVFLTRGLLVSELRATRAEGVRLRLSAPGVSLRAVRFGQAGAPIRLGEVIDVVYQLRRNVWKGTVAAELEILDWRASDAPSRESDPG